ncbi:MAG: DUF2961 domain-containing protein [Candidatus Hydrogenedentes bacterium]|nr:DUF2961 domain-containing protein [Candidatus Hydrogenedentota bacterium]
MLHPSSHLERISAARSRRVSSWDRTGANDDCIRIEPGETRVLADIAGPGRITHLYMTMIQPHPLDFREAILRMFWDGEEHPSVEVPVGDFFCISNCTVRRFSSALMAIHPGSGSTDHGLNCYFPMPFATRARIELVNQSQRVFGGGFGRLWYHIDYEELDSPPPDDAGRFHAQWRRECLTKVHDAPLLPKRASYPRVNASGGDNYVILEAEGQGHIAGLHLQVDNVAGGWYGEGDDMVFIDGEPWPPSIHGTGTEEVFGGGACPSHEYAGLYTGFHLVENLGGETFKGKNAMFRWYLHDPIRFKKSVRMTIEHGHANDFENDYASVAYWYQREPHAAFPAMPPLELRRPLFPETYYRACDDFARLASMQVKYQDGFVFESAPVPEWHNPLREPIAKAHELLCGNEYVQAQEQLARLVATVQEYGEEFQF